MSYINVQVLAALGLTSSCVLAALPHTLLLTRYRGALASHQDGVEEAISPSMDSVIEKMMYALRVKEEEELNIKFFSCYGLDPVSKGSVNMRTGAIIGLPKTFSSSSLDEVDMDGLKLGRQSVVWDSPAGRDLRESLVLSERAQAFAVAREISYVRTHHVHIDIIAKMVMGCLAYTTGYLLNNSFGMKRRLKLVPRLVMYTLVGGFYGLFYLSLADTYYCFRDNRVDKRVGGLSRELAEGGTEFYTKVLQRNQAIRTLLGSQGASLYTPYGNVVTTIRQPHANLTTRRDNLLKILNNMSEDDKSDKDGYFSE